MSIDNFIDKVNAFMGPADGVIVAQEGQIDVPEEWTLVGTKVIDGKRVRVYDIPKRG